VKLSSGQIDVHQCLPNLNSRSDLTIGRGLMPRIDFSQLLRAELVIPPFSILVNDTKSLCFIIEEYLNGVLMSMLLFSPSPLRAEKNSLLRVHLRSRNLKAPTYINTQLFYRATLPLLSIRFSPS